MKVAFITAIYGPYEATCKKIVDQSIDVDKICFTNVENLEAHDWIVDRTPYHDLYKSDIDTDESMRNSIVNNSHTYNIAKYYKFQWHKIPVLKKYDVVIWLDGTIEITHPDAARMLADRALSYGVCTWMHERHGGILKNEVNACSRDKRFCTTNWFGQDQPFQPVMEQYNSYVTEGYTDAFWKNFSRKEGRGDNRNFGVWLTCMISWSTNNKDAINLNNHIYHELRKWTTMEQICLPKVAQDLNYVPYTLPDNEITGNHPHGRSLIHIKHRHGN